jgi:carbonic anhydrase/acetyltransferase-like protein (isoleucine patch superfamily)
MPGSRSCSVPAGASSTSLIHPSAFIAPGAIVLGDVSLGRNAFIWYNCVVRGDMAPITIGEETNIQDLTMIHVDAGVPCTIGRRVAVGHHAIVHGCTVEDESLIGMGAALLNRVHVGTGSLVAVGAVVREGTHIPPGSLVVGVPGRVARDVTTAETDRMRQT